MNSLLVALFLCFSVTSFAAEGSPTATTTLPNTRELSAEDYQLLGKLVWERMQPKADPDRRDLTDSDIHNMIDEMKRNRDELTLTLEDLTAVIGRSCPGPTPGGIQISDISRGLKKLLK